MLSVLILIPIAWLGYWELPIEINRSKKIKVGNELVEKIENYNHRNSHIPLSDDWGVLDSLGFKTVMAGTDPAYNKIKKNEYEIIFFEGFDPPHLVYNSLKKEWHIGTPKVPEENLYEENYPWRKEVTKAAIGAIYLSIENIKKPEKERSPNFPSNPFGCEFSQTDYAEFEISGYSTMAKNKEIYWINFTPKSEIKMSGPYITVEINIITVKAIQVYMKADA